MRLTAPQTQSSAPSSEPEKSQVDAPASPDELERQFGAVQTAPLVSTSDAVAERAAALQPEQPAPAVEQQQRPMQLTGDTLLRAFAKMFRAIMVFPGLAQPVEVAGAITKISRISINAHQELKQQDIHVPLTTCNELIADQWTASLFRQGEVAPEISSDWLVSAFVAATDLAKECSQDPVRETVHSAFLAAVASLVIPLEQYQIFAAQITQEKLNIDTTQLYLALAGSLYSSIEELTQLTPLATPECKVALYRALPEIFQSVWADWRDRIYSSTKKLDDAASAYQYLINLSEDHPGYPLSQVKGDCHEVLRRVVDSATYVLSKRG